MGRRILYVHKQHASHWCQPKVKPRRRSPALELSNLGPCRRASSRPAANEGRRSLGKVRRRLVSQLLEQCVESSRTDLGGA